MGFLGFGKKKDKDKGASKKSDSKDGAALEGKSATGKKPKAMSEGAKNIDISGNSVLDDILTSDELDEVSGAVQMATGNFGDDWGNNDISSDSIAMLNGDSNNPFYGNSAYFTAGIGGAISLYGNISKLRDENASGMDKAAAATGAIESGATMINKLTLGVEKSFGGSAYGGGDAGLSGLAVGLQTTGAIAGAATAGIGAVASGMEAFKAYKEGKKYDAAMAAASALQSGIGAVDKTMKVVHGLSAIAAEGTSAMGKSTALTGAAGNLSTGLGVAGAGIGVAMGAAQAGKGLYDYKKAKEMKTDLTAMKDDDTGVIDNDVIDTLIQGQDNKQKDSIESGVKGLMSMGTGILGIMAITGVGAPFAAAAGVISGVLIGGYHLYKYWNGARKQKQVDKIVDRYFHTTNDTDYAPYLDKNSDFKEYRDKRLTDIDNEKGIAKENKKVKDAKQESKGMFKKVFSKNSSKKAQKAMDKIDKREKLYSGMTEDDFAEEIASVNKVYNDSTHAKKIEAYEQAEKALVMLEKVSGENRKKLLKAIGISEDDYTKTKGKDKTVAPSTDAEKTAKLAKELMKILSQKKIEASNDDLKSKKKK